MMKKIALHVLLRTSMPSTLWRWAVPPLVAVIVVAASPTKQIPQEAEPEQLVLKLAEQSPRLKFHLGEVEDGAPKISPNLPEMPFAPSTWYVAQWQQPDYIVPSSLIRDDTSLRDPRLGVPTYSFKAQDRHASVALFRDSRRWLYRLSGRGGDLTSQGGSNLFLATPVASAAATLAARIDITLEVRLSAAWIVHDTAAAQASDGVLGQVFSGYGLMFRDPASGKRQFVFMQLPIADTVAIGPSGFHICSVGSNATRLLYVPPFDSRQPPLPYAPDIGSLHTLHYRLDRLVAEMLSHPLACQGGVLEWTAEQKNLANWRVTQFYIGLETSNRDMRPGASTHRMQGDVSVALDIGDVSITRQPDRATAIP